MSFQDNFEAFSGKVTEAAQLAAQKAKDLALIARAKVQILSEEDKIKKAQIELGRLSYRDFVAGAEPERGEYLPWYEKITESKKAIQELRTTIEAIRNSDRYVDDEDVAEAAEDAEAEVTEEDFADTPAATIEVEVVDDEPEQKEE